MKLRHILKLILISFILSGCVSILKDNQDPVRPLEATGTCEPVGVTASFRDAIYSDLSLEGAVDPKEKWRGSTNPSWLIIEKIKSSGVLVYPPTVDNPQKYYLSFKTTHRTYSNNLQRISFWVSNISAGILPGWGDGEYYLEAEVFDTTGNKIANYKSTVIYYDYYHGLIFLPINFGTRTLAYVDKTYLPQLTGEIIGRMIKDKLIRCAGST